MQVLSMNRAVATNIPSTDRLQCTRSTQLTARFHRARAGLSMRVGRAQLHCAAAADYELCYFDARGAAETSRVIFAIAGVDYTDNRYSFSFVDGKPQVEDRHAEDKAAGLFTQNLDRLPLLKVDNNTVVGQSKAIERYLASQFNMMGVNDLEAAQVDAFCEHVRDMSTAFGKERGNPFAPMSDDIKAALDKWYAETLPGWFARLEKVVSSEEGYAVGGATSYADVCLHQLVNSGGMGADERTSATLEAYPKLAAIVSGVGALESLKAWEAARPQTAF